jgi:hypothetical protein
MAGLSSRVGNNLSYVMSKAKFFAHVNSLRCGDASCRISVMDHGPALLNPDHKAQTALWAGFAMSLRD